MELGGNAPFLVFDDADLDKAVEGAMLAKMRNMGEACTAANRFLVHRSVAEEFADRLAERMGALTVGRGTEDGVQVGPLIDAKGRDKVADLVARRRATGAPGCASAASRVGRAGLLLPAHRAHRRPGEARLAREEIFGPVAPITVFDDGGRGRRRGQRHRVRPGQLPVHGEPDARAAGVGAAGDRDGRAQHRARLQPGGTVRRHQGVRASAARAASVGIDEFLETKYVAIGFGG